MTCPYCTAREAGAYGLHIATACRRCNAVLFRACLHAEDEETIAVRMSWLQRMHPEAVPDLQRWLAAERQRVARGVAA